MRTAIDLTSLSDNFSGLERMAFELTKAMLDEAPEDEFILVIKNEVPGMLKPFGRLSNVRFCRIKGKNKLVANQLTLPLTMSRIKADAYLFPAFPVPLLFNKKDTYGMIADLGCYDCPQTMKKKQVLFFREGAKHTAGISRKTLTISEFSKGRIEKLLHKQADDMQLLYCGINLPPEGAASKERQIRVREKYSLPGKYYLSLSTVEPRKNLKLLTDAYLELKAEGEELPGLVLAGREGWLMDPALLKAKEEGSVIFTGFVDDADLPALYAGAEAFIFPSLYEGFGMPPLEAQAAGVKKVLSSDAEALTEVLGDTALFFKNNDRGSLKQALKALAGYEGPGPGAVKKNLERFSWRESAKKLIDSMHEG
ncbi:MAG: glycosyltransferase family 4 protein [Lachnospiraceae bacterium]|nr:glycosyltransferase family 4 protein [Lachnospiraceae bacterium]